LKVRLIGIRGHAVAGTGDLDLNGGLHG
jgi:hypothetical protein